MIPVVQQGAAAIGITFKVRQVNGAFPPCADAEEQRPDRGVPGLAQGRPDPLTFFEPLFDGRGIIDTGNSLRARRAHAGDREDGRCDRAVSGVPGVDAMLDRCAPLAGQPRLSCYEALDLYPDDDGRPVGPVPVAVRGAHHRARP